MSIIIDYLEVSSTYQEKYGSKTVILYQVGSFFEIYSFFISKTNEISNITEIENVSSICNLNIAKKQAYVGENLDVNSIVLPFPKNKKDVDSLILLLTQGIPLLSIFRTKMLQVRLCPENLTQFILQAHIFRKHHLMSYLITFYRFGLRLLNHQEIQTV